MNEFDPYRFDNEIITYDNDDDEDLSECDEEWELNEFNSVPSADKLNGYHGYNDEQWN